MTAISLDLDRLPQTFNLLIGDVGHAARAGHRAHTQTCGHIASLQGTINAR